MKAKLITVLLVVFMVAGMLQGCTAIVSQAGAQPGSVQVILDSAELAAESKAIDDANKAAYAEKLLKMQDEVDVQTLRNAWDHIPYAEAAAWADAVAQKYEVESVDVQAIAAVAPEADEIARNTAPESAALAASNLVVENAVKLYRAGEIADYSAPDLAAVAPDAQLEANQRQYEAELQTLRNAWGHIPSAEAVAWADVVAQKYGVEPADVQAIIAAAPAAELEAQELRDSWGHSTYGNTDEVAPVEGAMNAASEALATAATSAQRAALETAAERQDLIEAQKVNEFMLHDAIEKAAASYPSAGKGDQMNVNRVGLEAKVEKAAASYPSAGKGDQLASSRLLLELEKSIEKAAASYPSAGKGDQITINKERFGAEKVFPPRNGRGLCAK